ncbi:hypothetical protein H0H81_010349 [Sphagnurus paluster]|uniref:FAD-binding FR-type domain-containing protein n=1 Tax=Sphagnurus paluster TaxID=117069 RepID=A0A9P7K5C6_9AGAR|nr:hypothetical protein H0H81_010349 [Sphagnurus paluster]
MPDTGAPPVIPTELQPYNSYVQDPIWQLRFTYAWTAALALFLLASVPKLFRARGLGWHWVGLGGLGLRGVREVWSGEERGVYQRVGEVQIQGQGDKGDRESVSTGESVGKGKKTCCGGLGREERGVGQGKRRTRSVPVRVLAALGSVWCWTPRGLGGVNAGQILLILTYLAILLTCILTAASLSTNGNRAGFLALAQLPPLFLLASKNSPLSVLLLPSHAAWTRVAVLHRWVGRGVVLAATVHGALWIQNHLRWGIVILGPGQEKEGTGVAALAVLGVIAFSSVRVVRERAWGVFYWIHALTVPAFFITMCYHTPYASPWIAAPLALYAFDVIIRATRFRVRDARLIRVDGGMTLIHIPDCDAGFRAGQHLRLRVFVGGHAFEAHPLSIMSAPPSSSIAASTQLEGTCLRAGDVQAYYAASGVNMDVRDEMAPEEPLGILLGARVVGDWTRAINEYADQYTASAAVSASTVGSGSGSNEEKKNAPATSVIPVPVQVLLDGPYGGCTLTLPAYERVLLVAGGSGATFAIGVLDALVAACRAGERRRLGAWADQASGKNKNKAGEEVKTREIHFVWSTKSFASIKWFAPLLRAIAAAARGHVVLKLTVYVTCMCSPEDAGVPGLAVRIGARPDVGKLVRGIAGADDFAGSEVRTSVESEGSVSSGDALCACGCVDADVDGASEEGDVEKGVSVGRTRLQGALGVCASGPAGLVRETANAVARYKMAGGEAGLHTEVFAI